MNTRLSWIDVRFLQNMTSSLVLGNDMLYLPQPREIFSQGQISLTPKDREIFKQAIAGLSDIFTGASDVFLLSQAEQRYLADTEIDGEEPDWIEEISDDAKRYLRHNAAIQGTLPSFEPLAIVPSLPYTGISYIAQEGGLLEKLTHVFPIMRLANIRQLGFLQDPIVTSFGARGYSLNFAHTRYCHVLDVTAVMALMLHNNFLDPLLIHTGMMAGITHDTETPAGGDSMKFIDPEAFDEDKNYPQLLKKIDWSAIQREYQIPEDLLIDTIQNQGALGTMLDLADKMAYVARDAFFYLSRTHPFGPIAYPEGYSEIAKLIRQFPFICGVWEAVKIIRGETVITDPEKLVAFLKLRALFFRELYHHPGARFKEFLLGTAVSEYLYKTGRITRELLLSMTDEELEREIGKVLGSPYAIHSLNGSKDMRVELFSAEDEESAYQRERELIANGRIFTMIENVGKGVNPATHFVVEKERGLYLPLKDAFSEEAAEIEEIARNPFPIRLYYFNEAPTSFSSSFIKDFTAYRKREREKRTKS